MTGVVEVLAIVALGAVGTLVRAEVTWWSTRRTGDAGAGTWAVNLAGAFALGLVVTLAVRGQLPEPAARALAVGFLGGLTTFSTWMAVILRPRVPAADTTWPARRIVVHGLGMLLAGVATAGAGVGVAGLLG